MFQTKVLDKPKNRILYSIQFFFRKSCRLWDNLGKYGAAEQASHDYNMAQEVCDIRGLEL